MSTVAGRHSAAHFLAETITAGTASADAPVRLRHVLRLRWPWSGRTQQHESGQARPPEAVCAGSAPWDDGAPAPAPGPLPGDPQDWSGITDMDLVPAHDRPFIAAPDPAGPGTAMPAAAPVALLRAYRGGVYWREEQLAGTPVYVGLRLAGGAGVVAGVSLGTDDTDEFLAEGDLAWLDAAIAAFGAARADLLATTVPVAADAEPDPVQGEDPEPRGTGSEHAGESAEDDRWISA